MHFVVFHANRYIVGDGPSGIELACKIKDIFKEKFDIQLIEKSNEILKKNKRYT